MIKKFIFIPLFVCILAVSVTAIDDFHFHNVNLMNLYGLFNGTSVNASQFCDNIGNCTNATLLADINDVINANSSMQNYSDSQDDLINTTTNIRGLGFNTTLEIQTWIQNFYTLTTLIQTWISGNSTADRLYSDTRINSNVTSSNIQNVFSNETFSGQGFNGSVNSTNIGNTPALCSITNTFMTRYLGASSTCTAVDFTGSNNSAVNNTGWTFTDIEVRNLNATNGNITNVKLFQFNQNDTNVDCNEANRGTIHYNNDTNKFYGCNSTDWEAFN